MTITVDPDTQAVTITVTPQVATINVEQQIATITVNPQVSQITVAAQQGPAGAPGGTSTYAFDFVQPATQWTIAHFLNRYPSVTLIGTDQAVMLATYRYQDRNTIIAYFSSPTSGSAYLN